MATGTQRLTTPETDPDTDPDADGGIPRWAWAVVAAMALLVLWVTAPGAIRGTFSSPASFLRVTAVVVALVVLGRLVGRFVSNPPLAAVLRAVPVIAVGWWALVPYFSPSEVDEAFPVITAESTSTTVPPSASTPADGRSVDAPAGTASTTTATPTTTIATPAEPVLVRSGEFRGLTGHRGSGSAAIYDLADGSRLLRFENLDAGPGPDLDVYLVPRADATDLRDAIRVDDLTAERGNQNYAVPDGLDLTSGEWTVLIWCHAFTVEVANATIT